MAPPASINYYQFFCKITGTVAVSAEITEICHVPVVPVDELKTAPAALQPSGVDVMALTKVAASVIKFDVLLARLLA